MPASGLLEHTTVSRFMQHMLYYRQVVQRMLGRKHSRADACLLNLQSCARMQPVSDGHKALAPGEQDLRRRTGWLRAAIRRNDLSP
jgi:hypothetical protein